MTKLQQKLLGALATGSLLLGSISTSVFGATYTISGNGTNSQNTIEAELEREVKVEQSNEAKVDNNVTISATTGNNKAKDNTGGDVKIDTGNSEVGVKIQNELNTNMAQVDTCGGCAFDSELKIADNGSKTSNLIDLEVKSETEIEQENEADVENDVDITASSGDNKAKGNTGGSVKIDTGSVKVNPVMILNSLNANAAKVMGGDGNGGLSAWILGNGSKSQNTLDLEFESETEIEQENEADVANDVDVAANSGYNKAKDNTGDGVEIDTGNVEVGVLVDTVANFNLADVEECCLLDLEAKIADNGSKSSSLIELEIEDELEVEQENELDCDGHGWGWRPRGFDLFGGWWGKSGDKCSDVDVTADSGYNKVKDSTMGGHDPAIDTGDADVAVEVSNSGNVNTFGVGEFDLPDGDGGTSVDIDIDFGGLMELLEELIGLLS